MKRLLFSLCFHFLKIKYFLTVNHRNIFQLLGKPSIHYKHSKFNLVRSMYLGMNVHWFCFSSFWYEKRSFLLIQCQELLIIIFIRHYIWWWILIAPNYLNSNRIRYSRRTMNKCRFCKNEDRLEAVKKNVDGLLSRN